MRNVGDLSCIDKLFLTTVIDFVISSQEFLQLGLHVIIVDGAAIVQFKAAKNNETV